MSALPAQADIKVVQESPALLPVPALGCVCVFVCPHGITPTMMRALSMAWKTLSLLYSPTVLRSVCKMSCVGHSAIVCSFRTYRNQKPAHFRQGIRDTSVRFRRCGVGWDFHVQILGQMGVPGITAEPQLLFLVCVCVIVCGGGGMKRFEPRAKS